MTYFCRNNTGKQGNGNTQHIYPSSPCLPLFKYESEQVADNWLAIAFRLLGTISPNPLDPCSVLPGLIHMLRTWMNFSDHMGCVFSISENQIATQNGELSHSAAHSVLGFGASLPTSGFANMAMFALLAAFL